MPYIVVEEKTVQGIVEEVASWEVKGFKPQGGIMHTNMRFYQALYQDVEVEVAPLPKPKRKTKFEDVKVLAVNPTPDPLNSQYRVAYSIRGVKQNIVTLPEIMTNMIVSHDIKTFELPLWEYLHAHNLLDTH